jgi:tetratricopeptide (TPR) repeat protein
MGTGIRASRQLAARRPHRAARAAEVPAREEADGSASLIGYLNAPLIGLRPFVHGPLYAEAIEHYWRALERWDREPAFWIQRTLPGDFRNRIAREAGALSHVVDDPRDVSPRLRSERWAALCRQIEGWADLPARRCARVAALLHALGFYEVTRRLVPEPVRRLTGPDEVLMAYWQAAAGYMVGLPPEIRDYAGADMTAFERIASEGGAHPVMRLLAAIKLLVHEAKTSGRIAILARAAARAEGLLAGAVRAADPFFRHLYTSHFHRAVAMVAQAQARPARVARHMDRAERHARAMVPRTDAERVLARENLHPVLESRTKEAIWRGRPARALELARAVVAIDPYDPKSWLEVGEALALNGRPEEAAHAYAAAALLGPPGSVVGLHMAGVCLGEAGRSLPAYTFLLQSVVRDRSARSSIAHALAMEGPHPPFRPGADAWLRAAIRLD